MKTRSAKMKIILNACKMSFDGKNSDEIATALGVHASVLTRYRQTEIWKEFEQELIAAYKQSLLREADPATLDGTS